jgi:hypothetical protein
VSNRLNGSAWLRDGNALKARGRRRLSRVAPDVRPADTFLTIGCRAMRACGHTHARSSLTWYGTVPRRSAHPAYVGIICAFLAADGVVRANSVHASRAFVNQSLIALAQRVAPPLLCKGQDERCCYVQVLCCRAYGSAEGAKTTPTKYGRRERGSNDPGFFWSRVVVRELPDAGQVTIVGSMPSEAVYADVAWRLPTIPADDAHVRECRPE